MPPPPGVSQETHVRMKITPTQTGHDQGWQVVNTKHGKRKVLIPQDAPDADGKVVVYAPIAEPEPEELLPPAPAPGPEPAPEVPMLPGVPAAGQALPGKPPLPAPESGPPSGRLASPPKSATRPLESSVQHEMDLVRQENQGIALTQSQVQEQTVQLLARANAAEQKKLAAKKWVEENNEHISSINTIAAWLLMPALDRNAGNWLGRKYWWQYTLCAIFFTALQCFVVTAMLTDGTVRIQRGDFADEEILNNLGASLAAAGAGFDANDPMREGLSGFGLPPRDVKYCKNEEEWKEMFLALVNASVPVKDAQRFADYYKGAYVGCWEPYSDDAGEPIFTAELITGAMMLCFFFVEVMDEEAEMFLQALLVFSGPQNYATGKPQDATMYRIHHPWFWIKSLMLDIFLGLRFYFVAAVAVASGQLIMMEPGVVECVLNGIALLFVVTFDEKLFTLMVNKDHTTKFTMEMAHAHNRDAIFEYKDKQALGHTFLAACIAAISALGIRLFPDEEGSSLRTFLADATPGAPMNRENFMIFVLAIAAWVAHAVAAGLVVREAHKQRELEPEDTGVIRYPKISVGIMQLRSLVAVICWGGIVVNFYRYCSKATHGETLQTLLEVDSDGVSTLPFEAAEEKLSSVMGENAGEGTEQSTYLQTIGGYFVMFVTTFIISTLVGHACAGDQGTYKGHTKVAEIEIPEDATEEDIARLTAEAKAMGRQNQLDGASS